MKYLITGITGFAGPHLAKLLLDEGHEVHGVVRTANGREMDLVDVMTVKEIESIRFHYVDLKDYMGLQKVLLENFDGVFHLAAQSHPPTSFLEPVMTWNDNVSATMNLITLLEGKETKLMFCSTSEVYGDTGKDVGLLGVDSKLLPSNPYGASKAAIDLYLQERFNNQKVRGFITRAFSHTGPRRGKIFSISSDAYQIAKMELGLQEKVLKIGNLQTERVVIDVRDCVNAYYKLMQTDNSNGNVYNVCGEEVHKMQYYTDCLIEASSLNYDDVEQRIHKPFYRDIDIQVQIGDVSDLKRDTDWQPKIPLSQTMSDLLHYWISKLK
jgi:GDPmannose 4,6-dehydratase|tara:strand:+ start:60 stop:1034 length:975 start_codon:yes stop_codon:yes gene_type:complete